MGRDLVLDRDDLPLRSARRSGTHDTPGLHANGATRRRLLSLPILAQPISMPVARAQAPRPGPHCACRGVALGRPTRDTYLVIRLSLTAMLWLLLSGAAEADWQFSDGSGIERFRLQGFGTVGGPFYSSTDEATYIRDRSQPDGARGPGLAFETDSRLGIQASWTPTQDLEATVQLVAKYRYDGTYRPQVPWAFVKYAFNPDVQIRAGRLGYDAYLLSDSRDVGYSYLWVRPPVDYFGQIHYSYFEGLDLTARHALGDAIVKGKLYLGQLSESSITPEGTEYALRGSWLGGGYLDFQSPHWQVRAGGGLLRLELGDELPSIYLPLLDALRGTGTPQAAAVAEELSGDHTEFSFLTAGLVYDKGALQSQLQLRHLWTETKSYAGNTAGYWSLGYRLGRWTPYLVYSRIKSEHERLATGLPDVSPFATINDAVDRLTQTTQVDQETLSLGARFDFTRDAAIKLQVDWIHSRDNPSLLWLDVDPDWNGRAMVLSATLDFVF